MGGEALGEIGDHVALVVLVGARADGEVPGGDAGGDDYYDEDWGVLASYLVQETKRGKERGKEGKGKRGREHEPGSPGCVAGARPRERAGMSVQTCRCTCAGRTAT